MNFLFSTGFYLLNAAFSLVLYLLWLRIGLRWARVPLNNELVQTVLRWTNVLLIPFAKIFRNKGPYDRQAFFAVLLIDFIRFYLLTGLEYRLILYPWIVLVSVLGDCLSFPCHILFYALLIRVLMSWAMQSEQHPVYQAVNHLTQPLLNRLGPLCLVGLDFTPWIGMVLLKGLSYVVEASMPLQV